MLGDIEVNQRQFYYAMLPREPRALSLTLPMIRALAGFTALHSFPPGISALLAEPRGRASGHITVAGQFFMLLVLCRQGAAVVSYSVREQQKLQR